jgi:hypothetical protein
MEKPHNESDFNVLSGHKITIRMLQLIHLKSHECFLNPQTEPVLGGISNHDSFDFPVNNFISADNPAS